MADWRKLALEAILADGEINENEIQVLREELCTAGKIEAEEVKFLIELGKIAQKKAEEKKGKLNPKFEQLFFRAIMEAGGGTAQKHYPQIERLREMGEIESNDF